MRQFLAAVLSVGAIGAVVVSRSGSVHQSGPTKRGLVAGVHYARDKAVVAREAQRKVRAGDIKSFAELDKFTRGAEDKCWDREFGPFRQVMKGAVGDKWSQAKAADGLGKVAEEFEQ